ncbi:MAG: ECF-type sigma factor [Longimicrobiales bacterium]
MTDPPDVTDLLLELDGSGREAVDLLFERLHSELRAIAANRLGAERPDHTLSATALVNEAYVKLAALDRLDWKNRAQFFAVAARAMRRILVNHARDRQRLKRGGGGKMVTLVAGMGDEPADRAFTWEEVLVADDALERLAALDERQAQVVEMRVFGGLTHDEVAEALDVSAPTVQRDWRVGRAFLIDALT